VAVEAGVGVRRILLAVTGCSSALHPAASMPISRQALRTIQLDLRAGIFMPNPRHAKSVIGFILCQPSIITL
jgi:hypothetical protein